MKSTQKKTPDLRLPLVLLVILGAMLWVFLRPRSVEGLVPVVRDSRIALIAHLDDAIERRGFKENERYLGVYVDPLRNVDDDGLPFPMPLDGAVEFDDLPVHEGATLRIGHGIDAVNAAEAEGASVTFIARVRPHGSDEAGVEILRAKETLGAPGSAPTRRRANAPLPRELVGRRVDLTLETNCDRVLPELSALPVFLSPVLESKGEKVRVERLAFTRRVLLHDLLTEFDAAREADDDLVVRVSGTPTAAYCFAIRREAAPDGSVREEYLPVVHAELTGAFATTATQFGHPEGGSWPSIMFGADDTLVRYPIDVPKDGAVLEFMTGVDYRGIGVGDAQFGVTVDGERVFDEVLDPEARVADLGWHAHRVDLARWAGRTVRIGFHGRVTRRQDVRLALMDSSRPLGEPTPYELDVKWPQGAFGRPRVVREIETGRRLAAKDRPSVVYVNVETWRRDAAGCYGGPDGITPTLDRLAAEGTRFDDCLSAASWTAPSVASLFSGVFPQTHGVVGHNRAFLADAIDTLAERAQEAGVTTAAFVTNDYIGRRQNFDQGFESFLQPEYANARQVVSAFEDWLQDNGDLQFFAYLHFFEPHDPCNAPGEDFDRYVPGDLKGADSRAALARVFERTLGGTRPSPADDDIRLLRGRYFGEVRYFDRQLERLVAALRSRGLEGRVVLVVSADHGEEFGEHGLIGHGSNVYAESVRVPLVVWGPGCIPAGRVVEAPVGTASLHASVLDLLQATYDANHVRPPLRLRGGASGGDMAYSVTAQGILKIEPPDIYTRTFHGLRTADYALVYSPGELDPDAAGDDGQDREDGEDGAPGPAILQLFDRRTDPGETINLRDREPQALARLQDLLRRAVDVARSRTLGISLENPYVQVGYVGGRTDPDADAERALFPPGETYEDAP